MSEREPDGTWRDARGAVPYVEGQPLTEEVIRKMRDGADPNSISSASSTYKMQDPYHPAVPSEPTTPTLRDTILAIARDMDGGVSPECSFYAEKLYVALDESARVEVGPSPEQIDAAQVLAKLLAELEDWEQMEDHIVRQTSRKGFTTESRNHQHVRDQIRRVVAACSVRGAE